MELVNMMLDKVDHSSKLAYVFSKNCWYVHAARTKRVWKRAKREDAATAPGGRRTADGRAAATTHTVAAVAADAEAKTIAATRSWRNLRGREGTVYKRTS